MAQFFVVQRNAGKLQNSPRLRRICLEYAICIADRQISGDHIVVVHAIDRIGNDVADEYVIRLILNRTREAQK